MSDREQLLSMGFEPARVDWALRATQNRGLQPAMDHLIENEGRPIPSADPQADQATSGSANDTPMNIDDDDEDAEALRAALKMSQGGSSGAAAINVDAGEAKSIKCSQCGKTFKNTALAEFHAEKSGHDQFEESTEEIKPLTEEEKKQKLADLREKMSQKRAMKSKADAEENKANEMIRRKAARDQGVAKAELETKQAVKDAERKKREKIEDAKAKAAVKAQIEADKRERAEKAKREKEAREGGIVATPAPQQNAPAGASVASKDYKETRLQIRLASGGQTYVTTLPSESTLREVAEFLAGQVLTVDVETVSFAMHFPRKQFSRTDFNRTLKELGLTPSAVLIAS